MFGPGEATPEVLARCADIAEKVDDVVHGHLKREALTALANVTVAVIQSGDHADEWLEEFLHAVNSIYEIKKSPPPATGN